MQCWHKHIKKHVVTVHHPGTPQGWPKYSYAYCHSRRCPLEQLCLALCVEGLGERFESMERGRNGAGEGSDRAQDRVWQHQLMLNLFPLPGVICQNGSTQTCASNITGTGPRCSIVVLGLSLWQRTNEEDSEETFLLLNSPAGCSKSCADGTAPLWGNFTRIGSVGLLCAHKAMPRGFLLHPVVVGQ